jgi:tetratricopeptide (TPR) repeat protein
VSGGDDLNELSSARAHATQGIALFAQQDYEGALTELTAALRIDPSSDETLVYKGAAYFHLGDLERATLHYDAALDANPQNVDALTQRGSLRFGQGKFAAVVEDLSRVILLQPQNVRALQNRAMARRQLGQIRLAEADDARARALQSPKPTAAAPAVTTPVPAAAGRASRGGEADVGDETFMRLALQLGNPTLLESVRQLSTQQAQLQQSGQRVSLFGLARLLGVLAPEQAQWFLDRSVEKPVAATTTAALPSVPAPSVPKPPLRSSASSRKIRAGGVRATRRGSPDPKGKAPVVPIVVAATVVGLLVMAFLVASSAGPRSGNADAVANAEDVVTPEAPTKRQIRTAIRRAYQLLDKGQGRKGLAGLRDLEDQGADDRDLSDALNDLTDLIANPPARSPEPPRRREDPAVPVESLPTATQSQEVVVRPVPPRPSKEEATEPDTGDFQPPEDESGEPSLPSVPGKFPAPDSKAEHKPQGEAGAAAKVRGAKRAAATPIKGASSGLSGKYIDRRERVTSNKARDYCQLARWARKSRLFKEELEAYSLALRLEPENSIARKALAEIHENAKLHAEFHTPWRRDAKVLFVETNTTEAQLHHYCDMVSAFYSRFSKIFKVKEGPLKKWKKRIGVHIFRTRRDFDRYQRETGSNPSESAIGYYSLKNKELVLYYDPDDPAGTLNTLFHEGTHLFVNLSLPSGVNRFRLPIWLSEGIADYFGASQYDTKEGKLLSGLPNYGRLRDARAYLQSATPSLRGDLLANTDYSSFKAIRYALSWALTHMLIEKKKGSRLLYRKRFVAYYEAVSQGKDPVRSFEKLIGPIPKIEREWHAYIRDFEVRPFEEGLDHLRRGDYDEAVVLFQSHCDDNAEEPKGFYYLGLTLEWLGLGEEAVQAYDRAVTLNPDYARAHSRLAKVLRSQEVLEKALSHAQRAVEISPTGENYEELARAALSTGDKTTANTAVEMAITRLGATEELRELKELIGESQ